MKRICLKKECIGCLNCYNLCKFGAVNLKEDRLGFVYAEIDENKCTGCNMCKNKCPILAKQTKNVVINECYACKNKNDNVRLKSSSGGMFYALAKNIISQNGVVYGAGYDENLNVIHKRINKVKSIEELMGSKYIQSNINNIFYDVKKDLDANILVLFTGTPCQIYALKTYLGKEYTNLYLQDFVCHGVGSKKVFNKHLVEIKDNNKFKKVNSINFRDKISGWKKFSLSIKSDKEQYSKDLTEDNFMKTFLKNLCLRDSCYECKYKGDNRCADITLADFWGIDKLVKDYDDDKGASAVIINTLKGKELFENIKAEIVSRQVKYTDVSENNICLEKPPIYNRHRDEFIKDIESNVKLSNINEEYYKK